MKKRPNIAFYNKVAGFARKMSGGMALSTWSRPTDIEVKFLPTGQLQLYTRRFDDKRVRTFTQEDIEWKKLRMGAWLRAVRTLKKLNEEFGGELQRKRIPARPHGYITGIEYQVVLVLRRRK